MPNPFDPIDALSQAIQAQPWTNNHKLITGAIVKSLLDSNVVALRDLGNKIVAIVGGASSDLDSFLEVGNRLAADEAIVQALQNALTSYQAANDAALVGKASQSDVLSLAPNANVTANGITQTISAWILALSIAGGGGSSGILTYPNGQALPDPALATPNQLIVAVDGKERHLLQADGVRWKSFGQSRPSFASDVNTLLTANFIRNRMYRTDTDSGYNVLTSSFTTARTSVTYVADSLNGRKADGSPAYFSSVSINTLAYSTLGLWDQPTRAQTVLHNSNQLIQRQLTVGSASGGANGAFRDNDNVTCKNSSGAVTGTGILVADNSFLPTRLALKTVTGTFAVNDFAVNDRGGQATISASNPVWGTTNCTVTKDQIGLRGDANGCCRLTFGAGGGSISQQIASSASSRRVPFLWGQRLSGSDPLKLTLNGQTTILDPNQPSWGYIYFAGTPLAGHTINLNGTTVTFVASGATGNQVNIGTGTPAQSLNTTLANLASFANASTDPNISQATYDASIQSGQTTVQMLAIKFKTSGAAGNAFTLGSSNAYPSGTTLMGGATNDGYMVQMAALGQDAVSNPLITISCDGPSTWKIDGVGCEVVSSGSNFPSLSPNFTTWNALTRGGDFTEVITSSLPAGAIQSKKLALVVRAYIFGGFVGGTYAQIDNDTDNQGMLIALNFAMKYAVGPAPLANRTGATYRNSANAPPDNDTGQDPQLKFPLISKSGGPLIPNIAMLTHDLTDPTKPIINCGLNNDDYPCDGVVHPYISPLAVPDLTQLIKLRIGTNDGGTPLPGIIAGVDLINAYYTSPQVHAKTSDYSGFSLNG